MKDLYQNVDEYISLFPHEVQIILEEVRRVIKENAKDAIEKISWQMPTYVLKGNLVHFAAHKNHLGFYPGVSGISHFIDEISQYKWGKGSVQFPYSKPIPNDLIRRIVAFKVNERISEGEK